MANKVKIPKKATMQEKVRLIIYNTAVDMTREHGGYMIISDKKIEYRGD